MAHARHTFTRRRVDVLVLAPACATTEMVEIAIGIEQVWVDQLEARGLSARGPVLGDDAQGKRGVTLIRRRRPADAHKILSVASP